MKVSLFYCMASNKLSKKIVVTIHKNADAWRDKLQG